MKHHIGVTIDRILGASESEARDRFLKILVQRF